MPNFNIMNQGENDFSTQKISPTLISQIVDALKNKHYGSVEIFIENYTVTQITQRSITKLKNFSNGRAKFMKDKIQSGFSRIATNPK